MPQHEIRVTQPSKTVLHNDISFTISAGGRTLGELTISKGSIDWRPARRPKCPKLQLGAVRSPHDARLVSVAPPALDMCFFETGR